MKKIVLLSFADSRFSQSLIRLKKESMDFPFTDRFFYTEKDLPQSFMKILHFRKHRRGFGYWRWKPFLIKKVFDTLDFGDILVWSDAGNFLNAKGIDRFMQYLDCVDKSETGILVFKQRYKEKAYTKGDLFDFLEVYNNPEFTESFQIWCGCIFLKKTLMSSELIKKWLDLHLNHYDLTTDKCSVVKNYPDFVEHRHDQSTFSLLVKMYFHEEITYDECYVDDGEWDKLDVYPIQARRLRYSEQHLWKKNYRRFILTPYHILLVWYLRLFENMYFVRFFSRY